MAEQRIYATSAVQPELTSRASTDEDETASKAKVLRRNDLRTGRAISGPASLDLSPEVAKTHGHGHTKPLPIAAPKEIGAYRLFRQLCDEIINELRRVDHFLVGDDVSDEGSEVVVEVEELLENLYNCPFGQGESLKRVIVAIQSQVNNVQWTRQHVEFLRDVMRFLRVRYLVDEGSVQYCYEVMKHRGLDPFRGSICEPRVLKRYRVDEVREP